MVPLSLSIALTIRVGFLLGAGKTSDAKHSAELGLLLAVVYALLGASMLLYFRANIPSLYTSESEVIELSASLLFYAALFQLADGLQVTSAGALRGYKDTKAALVIMGCTFWCFGLPLGYALGLTDIFGEALQAPGFWMGLVAGLAATCGLLLLRLKFIFKLN